MSHVMSQVMSQVRSHTAESVWTFAAAALQPSQCVGFWCLSSRAAWTVSCVAGCVGKCEHGLQWKFIDAVVSVASIGCVCD
jgi:hypothetical protein